MANPSGDANRINREYLDSILIEERLIGSVEADTSVTLFGRKYSSPIMMPAFSHLKAYGEGRETGLLEYARATKEMGLLNFIGMAENPVVGEIIATGADTVRIVKPYADRNKVYDQLRYAEKQGAVAVGVDIDHIFGMDGKYDIVLGEPMKGIDLAELRDMIHATNLPFIVKGVLSARDAVLSLEAGAAALLVSHHHGRMPFAMPPAMALPGIRAAVGKNALLFADCGVDDGVDAFKLLALGANAVAVGRAMLPTLEKGGTKGLCDFLKQMNGELATMMNFTGAKDIASIDPAVLHCTWEVTFR